MKLNRDWIAARVPHQGSMCLLDEVLEWDAQQVLCRSSSHRRADHPLRAHGRLGSASAIEYGAQAAAVHRALLLESRAGGPNPTDAPRARPAGALIASARALELLVWQLDQIGADLLVRAQRLHDDALGALYRFDLRSAGMAGGHDPTALARGRLTLWLQPQIARDSGQQAP
jgi:predicted hotdog family 3-hydroxylacyl-ACP dehydratase